MNGEGLQLKFMEGSEFSGAVARMMDARRRGMKMLSATLREESITQVRRGFREGVDPYGRKWPASQRVAQEYLRRTLRNQKRAKSYAKAYQKAIKSDNDDDFAALDRFKFKPDRPVAQTMRVTGQLMNSFTAQPTAPAFFVVGTNIFFAKTHQYGATIRPKHARRLVFKIGKKVIFAKEVHIPQRMMVPENVLGARWGEAFNDAAEDVMDVLFPSDVP